MIKVLSGWGGPGGSTVAFNSLVNLFNSAGIDACFYTPNKWEGITCKWDSQNNVKLNKEDRVIYHFMGINQKLPVKKQILSCHETNLFKIKEHKDLVYDDIHFVSNFQKDWHGLDGIVIPNVITKYHKPVIKKWDKVAGILGSIDPHKCVHESIRRALEDTDVSKVILCGAITDPVYFVQQIMPLINFKVVYCGVSKDMQGVYDQIDVVYSSSKRECLPMIQGECLKMGLEYRGLESNTRSPEDYEFDDNIILKEWKKCLEL